MPDGKRWNVIRALSKRDVRRYFGNPTGYVFITLFIVLSAAAAFWRPRFFLDNLANLDQLNELFPYLLLFFIPALTMGVWAEERREGTDELLLTLPASDFEVVVGKYAAVVTIYTVSLILSLSHVAVLRWLGHPDVGLIVSNYIGYWFAGAALIAVGMVASLVTSNTTVAFILACALCAVPILIDTVIGLFGTALGRLATPLTLPFHFANFARGVVSAADLFYFVGLGALFLGVNVVAVGRGHRRRGADRLPLEAHYGLRWAALVVALISIGAMLERVNVRADVTAERIHSLSPETRRLIAAVALDRPVTVQAFISPEVPEEYVQAREDLIAALNAIGALDRRRVHVTVYDTAPYSEAARIARERFGIPARLMSDPYGTRPELQQVYLGVAFTCGADEQVVPFFEHGASAEYELTRAIRVVARTARKRIGVVDGDTNVFGGIDFQTSRSRLPWTIVGELQKQYTVVQITPAAPIKEQVDALVVIMPSRLLHGEMDHVFESVRQGVPTLLLVDPLPAMNPSLAPAYQMASQVDPYQTSASAYKNVGDIRKALESVGVNWTPARIVWDSYRPHPEMSEMPLEAVFVGKGSGNAQAFNQMHPATADLQELVMLYPGYLLSANTPGFTFEPLVRTGRLAGSESYFELFRPTPNGPMMDASLAHNPEGRELALAAQIRSTAAQPPVNLIVVADVDFISDGFFALEANGPAAGTFDNVTFFLNCIDVLSGDDSFIALRTRRVKHRTLERVEAQTRTFIERRGREEQRAARDAQDGLEQARSHLKKMLDDVDRRADLDAQAKQMVARNIEETENRKLQVLQTHLEMAKDAKVQASRDRMEADVRRIQSGIRVTSMVLPPAPVFVLGLVMLIRRRRQARQGAAVVGRLRDTA